VVGAAAVLVIAAGITGLVVGSGTSRPAASSPKASPSPKADPSQKAILASVASSLGDKTADLHLSVAVDLPNGTQVTATGTGGVDFTHHESAATVEYAGATAMAGTRMSEVMTGDTAYLSLPSIEQLVPGKSWVAESTSDGASTPGTSDPADLFQIMESRGDVVTPEGPTTIGGVALHAFRVSISQAAIAQRVAQSDVPASVKQAASSMFGSKGIQLTVYVNDATDLLQEVDFSTELTIKGVTAVEHATQTYTNYGAPVSVEIPPPSQVISLQQFEQAAASAGAAPSAS
jgi:hypothetical protein